MVILGLLLILVGGVAIASAVFVSEPGTGGELLGFEVTTIESFLVGVAAGPRSCGGSRSSSGAPSEASPSARSARS